MNRLTYLLAFLFATTALAQVPPFIRNSFDTNSEAAASAVVSSLARAEIAASNGNWIPVINGSASNSLSITGGIGTASVNLDVVALRTNAQYRQRFNFGDDMGQVYSWQVNVSTNTWNLQRQNGDSDFPIMVTRAGVKLGSAGATTTNSGNLLVNGWVGGINIFPLATPAVKDLFRYTTRLVFDGDSLTSSNFGHAHWTSNRLGSAGASLVVSNVAVSGQTIPQMISRYTNFVQPCKPAGTTNAILFAWGGINDLFFATNSVDTIIATLSNYYHIAKLDAFTLVAFTISSRSDFPAATTEQNRAYVNRWIRSQYGVWDYLVDVDAVFPSHFPTEFYFQEGVNFIHFTTNAQQIISDMALAAIFSLRGLSVPPNNYQTRYWGTNLFASASAASPSVSFVEDRDTGIYRASTDFLGFAAGGVGEMVLAGSILRLSSDITVQFASGAAQTTSGDVGLSRTAAGALALGNGSAGNTVATLTTSNGVFTGSVGIGTNAPAAALHVVGSIQVDGGIPGQLTLNGTNSNASYRLTVAPDARWTNEFRLDLSAAPAVDDVLKIHSVTVFGPTNIFVITNFARTNFAVSAHGDIGLTNNVTYFNGNIFPVGQLTNFWVDFTYAEREIDATNNVHFSALTNRPAAGRVKYSTVLVKTFGGLDRIISFDSTFFLKGTNNYNAASNGVYLVGFRDNGSNTVVSITQ